METFEAIVYPCGRVVSMTLLSVQNLLTRRRSFFSNHRTTPQIQWCGDVTAVTHQTRCGETEHFRNGSVDEESYLAWTRQLSVGCVGTHLSDGCRAGWSLREQCQICTPLHGSEKEREEEEEERERGTDRHREGGTEGSLMNYGHNICLLISCHSFRISGLHLAWNNSVC